MAVLAAVLVSAAGCSRVPRIIVLEDPLTAAEHVQLGVAYERKGALDLAQREYEKALRKDGAFVQARVNLGNVHLAGKDYGRAREQYLKALELAPGSAEAVNNLAWAAILSGDGIEDALARMEALLAGAAAPGAPLLDTLGVLRMRAGRPEAAAEAFTRAETVCAGADDPPGGACTPEVRREIEEHRLELLRRFPPAVPAPSLVK